MNSFSISQLEQFSGIKAHTIRIWEQRYKALNPNRSQGNTRHYDNAQLRRLLNIVSLMDSDYKVSELCGMSDEALFRLLEEQLTANPQVEDGYEYFISQLIAAGVGYDETHFEKIFSNCVLRLGLKATYVKVIYPILARIGLMWANDTLPPTQEHFISNLVRQKLCSAIDALPPAKPGDTWLLFLPEEEFHEIGLLIAHYLIRKAGKKVIYLGSNVPLETLAVSVKEIAPTDLLFFLVHRDKQDHSQQYLNSLSDRFSDTRIHFSGNEKLISQLKTGKNLDWVRSVDELEERLQ